MKVFRDLTDPAVAQLMQRGAIGIIPTDTLYGIVASIDDKQAVERLYDVRKRDGDKPCIVLIARRDQITDTAAWLPTDWRVTKHYWPGPFSIVLPTTIKTPAYLNRGQPTQAYRLPDHPKLRVFLGRVGPVIAPTANMQGQPPARTLAEAQAYFGDGVDFYVDGGFLEGAPSTLIKTKNQGVVILRQGVGVIASEDLAT